MQRYYFIYNGIPSTEQGVAVSTQINFPSREEVIDEYERTGAKTLYRHRGYYKPATITIPCNFISKGGGWYPKVRELQKWLCGTGTLQMSDDLDYFYKVESISIGTVNRVLVDGAEFTITIKFDGFAYLVNGAKETVVENNSVILNRYVKCFPVLIIEDQSFNSMEISFGDNRTVKLGKFTGTRLELHVESGNVIEVINGKRYLRPKYMNPMDSTSKGLSSMIFEEGHTTITITQDGLPSSNPISIIPNWRI